MIESLASGGFDLAVGSRLLNPSLTTRGFKREFFSRGYNLLVRTLFRTRFSDAQGGFKAIAREAAWRLLPLVADNGWLRDTELLILAERMRYRVFDLPVHWVEDSDSRVKIWRDAFDAVKGLIRMRGDLAKAKYRRDDSGNALQK